MTLNASAGTVLTGGSVTISGKLTGTTLPATVHVLWDEYPQFGGVLEDTVQTDSNGNWLYTFPSLTESTWFFAEHRAGPDSVGGWTGRTLVEVRKRITASVDPGLRVRAGTRRHVLWQGRRQPVLPRRWHADSEGLLAEARGRHVAQALL